MANYDEMTTEQLQELLRQDFDDTNPLPLDSVLEICKLLTHRIPPRRSAEEAWEEFCKHYLPEVENNEERCCLKMILRNHKRQHLFSSAIVSNCG